MKIKDIFVREIDREIKGVIKVGQEEIDQIYNELDEYVVTNELLKHFRDFFEAYEKGIDNKTDKMGVWISGFFGSGKSHFLKILSYILENKEVNGRKAIDFFSEDKKITDDFVLAQMEKAASTPTDVILFNIDSKSDSSGQKTKDSILNVFLKVFNEMLGYSTDPHLADLERSLDQAGKYDDFKHTYLSKYNQEWFEARHEFNFYRGRVQEILVDIGFMSDLDAKLWSDTTTQQYKLSIEDFSKMVLKYIESKNNNQHVVFLVDEIGQYVGDDTDLMLNLQTITEDLGRVCNGKAWVVVTSQQDIDSMTEVKGNDFSKIQGRFDTRLSLTSANVDEVIKLRILEKKEVAKETLKLEYKDKETILNNLIIFNDATFKGRYNSPENFAEMYPFIPYQSDILGHVLNSIRRYGASGKHLSEGERSMLALFQKSAESIKDKEIGELISFDLFYDELENFLDNSHAGVIKKAYRNEIINPYNETNNFKINVLKTLFMIKYVDEIEPNVENITTLMVSNINNDRHDLKEKVNDALLVLEQQMLIQKIGTSYIFLTDEEQEINRAIQNQKYEESEIIKEMQQIIFEDIIPDNTITMKSNNLRNRYNFNYEKHINDVQFKRADNAALKLAIITPDNEIHDSEAALSAISLQNPNTLYIRMGDDSEFLDEIILSIKIDKFLKSGYTQNVVNIEDMLSKKRKERQEARKRADTLLKSNLEYVKFYVGGSEIKPSSTNFKNSVEIELEELALIVYNKLNYIDFGASSNDIHGLLASYDDNKTEIVGEDSKNINAIKDVINYVERITSKKTLTMRELMERFTKEPYGFVPLDVQWIITKLFVDNKIDVVFNGEKLNINRYPAKELAEIILRVTNLDRIIISIKTAPPRHLIESTREVQRHLFNKPITTEDADIIVENFKMYVREEMNNVRTLMRYGNKYPGQKALENILEYLENIHKKNTTSATLVYINEEKDNILESIDDYLTVKNFFENRQINLWNESLNIIQKFEEGKHELNLNEFNGVVEDLNKILKMDYPYSNISRLPILNDKFNTAYNDQLVDKKEPLYDIIENYIKEIESDSKRYLSNNESFMSKVESTFNNLKSDINKIDNLTQVGIAKQRIGGVFTSLISELNKEVQKDNPSDQAESVVIIKHKSLKEIMNDDRVSLEKQEDIDNYINKVKLKLEQELKDTDKIIVTY